MKSALVTGATSGIGAAIARDLAGAGYAVLALGRNPDALERIGSVAGITPIAVDLLDTSAVARALKGREPDILVNNAGIVPPPGPFALSDAESTETAIAVNVTVQMALTRRMLPGMLARGCGHLVFTGSVAAQSPAANMAVYSATKAGLSAFARALGLETRGTGVRVTEIVAGRVETDLYRSVFTEAQRTALYDGQTAVQPEDVARMVRAVLELPETAEVSRFEIVPTRSGVAVPVSEAKA